MREDDEQGRAASLNFFTTGLTPAQPPVEPWGLSAYIDCPEDDDRMTDSVTLEDLQKEMRAGFAEMRTGLADMRAGFSEIRARVDGVPILGVAIETLRQDVRMLRAAVNDMARVNITAGEVEALHTDLGRVQAKQMELETRIVNLERR